MVYIWNRMSVAFLIVAVKKTQPGESCPPLAHVIVIFVFALKLFWLYFSHHKKKNKMELKQNTSRMRLLFHSFIVIYIKIAQVNYADFDCNKISSKTRC